MLNSVDFKPLGNLPAVNTSADVKLHKSGDVVLDFSSQAKEVKQEDEKKGFFGFITDIISNCVDWVASLFGFNKEDNSCELETEPMLNDDNKEDNSCELEAEPMLNDDVVDTEESLENDDIKKDDLSDADVIEIDGEIDDFTQGAVGDCNYLAALKSFSLTKEGAKLIKDAIQPNVDSNGQTTGYNVTFPGINKTFFISNEELQKYDINETGASIETSPYSLGDDDVMLLEMAYEKYFTSEVGNIGFSPLNVVQFDRISELFTGKQTPILTMGEENDSEFYDFSIIKEMQTGDMVEFVEGAKSITDVNGMKVNIEGESYAFCGFDENNKTVILANSNNPSQEYTFPAIEIASNTKLIPPFASENDVLEAIKQGYPAVLGTGYTSEFLYFLKDANGNDAFLYPQHAYSVKSYNEESGVITLLNPHDPNVDIDISLEELNKIRDQYNYTVYDIEN